MKIFNTNNSNPPKLAVDAVLFAVEKDELKVLMIEINNGPYKNKWALPGGLVAFDESLDNAAKRVLFQKTNIEDIHLEQLYTFGEIDRDIRGRSVSVAYFALVNDTAKYNLKTTSYYIKISWQPVKNLPETAFDHKEIIDMAYKRLISKMEYSNIVYSLLPEEFTLGQLQKTYEIIKGKKIDKRNFRKRVLSIGMVEEIGRKTSGLASRPAELFHFSERSLKSY